MRAVLASCAAVVLLAGCGDRCANEVIHSVKSPDGRHVAVLFERSCGATTGFSSQVSILEIGEALRDGGNVFVADKGDVNAARTAWGGPWVDLRWTSATQLVVAHDGKARVFSQERNVGDVTVTYAPQPAPRG